MWFCYTERSLLNIKLPCLCSKFTFHSLQKAHDVVDYIGLYPDTYFSRFCALYEDLLMPIPALRNLAIKFRYWKNSAECVTNWAKQARPIHVESFEILDLGQFTILTSPDQGRLQQA